MQEFLNTVEKYREQFDVYFNELIDYNQKVNLTAITEKNDVFNKHFLDSILSYKNIKESSSVLDIGTGAGFPGLPLKIVIPNLKLTLVDSLNKRVEFLKMVCAKLSLKDVDCIHSRAEDFINKNREKYDYVVARAVASLNTLSEYCLPFVKVGGYFVAYKGANYQEEIDIAKNAINILGGKIEKIEEFNLLYNEGKRAVIYIKKERISPTKYPRPKNLPKLKPIL